MLFTTGHIVNMIYKQKLYENTWILKKHLEKTKLNNKKRKRKKKTYNFYQIKIYQIIKLIKTKEKCEKKLCSYFRRPLQSIYFLMNNTKWVTIPCDNRYFPAFLSPQCITVPIDRVNFYCEMIIFINFVAHCALPKSPVIIWAVLIAWLSFFFFFFASKTDTTSNTDN